MMGERVKAVKLEVGDYFPPKYDCLPGYTICPPRSALARGALKHGPWRSLHVTADGHATIAVWILVPISMLEPKFNEWGEDGL